MRLAEIFCKKYVLDCMDSTFTKITYILTIPLALQSSFSEVSEVLSSGLQCSFCSKQNLTHNSHFMHFLKKVSILQPQEPPCYFPELCSSSFPSLQYSFPQILAWPTPFSPPGLYSKLIFSLRPSWLSCPHSLPLFFFFP